MRERTRVPGSPGERCKFYHLSLLPVRPTRVRALRRPRAPPTALRRARRRRGCTPRGTGVATPSHLMRTTPTGLITLLVVLIGAAPAALCAAARARHRDGRVSGASVRCRHPLRLPRSTKDSIRGEHRRLPDTARFRARAARRRVVGHCRAALPAAVKPLYVDGNISVHWEGGAVHPCTSPPGSGCTASGSSGKPRLEGSDTKAGFNVGGGVDAFLYTARDRHRRSALSQGRLVRDAGHGVRRRVVLARSRWG